MVSVVSNISNIQGLPGDSRLGGIAPGIGSSGGAQGGARVLPLRPRPDQNGQNGTGAQGNRARLPSFALSNFVAQLFAQEDNKPNGVTASYAGKANSAYQTTSARTDRGGDKSNLNYGGEVEVPGLPPRLASGRLLDLSV